MVVGDRKCLPVSGHDHRDYKRMEVASGDEPRNKLNKSNGGGGANWSPGCTPMKINIFGSSPVFMIMIQKYIDYNGKNNVVAF